MKSNNISILALLLLSLVACEKVQEEESVSFLKDKVFYAETPSGDATKTYLNGELQVLWNADDRLSVFRSTTNERYRFDGEDGETRNAFHKDDESVPGEAFPRNYAVYPYLSGTSCTEEGILSVSLPATQSYTAGSFGRDANTMVAATYNYVDDYFHFKNVGSYLRLQLYGGDRIRSIKFYGNSGEKIAGKASITVDTYNAPVIAMSKEATTEITLDCGEAGVATPEDVSDAIPFWIVLPATSFSGGFTVEVTNTSGAKLIKSTTHPQTFAQNTVKTMAALKIDTQNAKEILSFSLSDGVHSYEAFNIGDDTIDVQLPNGIDMSNLVSTFTYYGTSVTVDDEEQTSGQNAHDFSDFVNPVQYIVHSKAGTTQAYTIRIFNLPVVAVETPNRKNITDKVNWIEGTSITIRETSIAGKMSLTEYSASVKGRGNTSWLEPKKPYAIKLDKKAEVLGMAKHKRWCLLSNCWLYYLCNPVGYELSRRTTSMDWAPTGKYVELILNGVYKGTYLLAEQIKIDKNRVDITEMSSSDISGEAVTGGYLLTYDTTYDERYKFKSQYYNMPVMFKDPDPDPDQGEGTLPAEQMDYVQNYINTLEASLKDASRLKTREYVNYIDVDTYIDQYFVWEIAGKLEFSNAYSDFSIPRSVWFHKDRGEKLKAGPVWDFDAYMFYDQRLVCNKGQYYGTLFKEPGFVARVKEKWPEYRARLDADGGMVAFVDSLYNNVKYAARRDWVMWPSASWVGQKYIATMDFDEQYATIRAGLPAKLDWLEAQIAAMVVNYSNAGTGTEDYGNQDDQTGGFDFGF